MTQCPIANRTQNGASQGTMPKEQKPTNKNSSNQQIDNIKP